MTDWICCLQWLGPLTSDLIGSHAILQVELNSTTDNPLIDVEGKTIHHGGNFQVRLRGKFFPKSDQLTSRAAEQAMAVTNTMEKTRLGVQQMGKLNYAQMTELVK